MDEAVLLDTDVFSYIARGDPRAEPFRRHLEGRRLCLSFATVAEVYKGFYRARWTEDRMARVEQHLKNFVVVPYDFELSRVCGRILAGREETGRRMEEFDAWVAATAVRHGMPLATNNRKHFEGVDGLALVPATQGSEGPT